MTQGLRNGEIGVVELHIFPHKTDGHSTVSALDGRDHGPPLTQIRLRCGQTQLPADHRGQICLLQIERRLIENGKGQILNDAVRLHVAEVSDFAEDARIGDWLVTAQNDDVRGDPQPLQLLHRMLGGLGFVFAGRLQIGDQRDMDKQGVARACFMSDLTDGLDKGLALYITDGPADLGDHDISFCFTADIVDEAFDLVGDVGDGLHGGPQILAPALLGDDVGVDFSCGEVGVLV